MKRYTVAHARQNLAEVLDAAEQGGAVVIERRGVRFAIQPVAPSRPARAARASRIAYMDPEIEAGTWSFTWSPGEGVEFATKPRRRARRA